VSVASASGSPTSVSGAANVAPALSPPAQPLPTEPPPTIVNLDSPVRHGRVTLLELKFDQPMEATRAQATANYVLNRLSRTGLVVKRSVPIRVAQYDPASHSVMLRLRIPVPARRQYQLTARGSGPLGLTSITAVPLAGAGTPATDWVRVFRPRP
jgi:hypothetical protein